MDFLADPAVLGGVVMGAVLSGWLMGRRHGAAALGDQAGLPEPEARFEARATSHDGDMADVTACQHAARAERRQVIEAARSLGELHEEVSAYRRREQVLASALSDGLLVELLPAAARDECRYLGLIGQPTCPLPGTGHETCASREGCTAAAASRWALAAHPSPEASALTRV
jgi:hypothetical protein